MYNSFDKGHLIMNKLPRLLRWTDVQLLKLIMHSLLK